jgi:hypothetical protein
MAILRNGILGNYQGKIGSLTFYTLNGKQVVRTIGKITKPPTVRQLQNRMEISVVNGFLRPIIEFINAGFAVMAQGTTKNPYNIALAYNKIQAVQGVYPDVTMNYEKVLVTEGKLPEAIDPAVELLPEGLSFTWQCPADLPWPRASDQVMLLVYFPALQKALYLLSGASRAVCQTVMNIQENLLAEYMEVYISFVAENRKGISNSSYLGSLNS